MKGSATINWKPKHGVPSTLAPWPQPFGHYWQGERKQRKREKERGRERETERWGPGALLCTDRPRKRRQAFFLFLRTAEGAARLLLLHKRINVKLSPSRMRGLRPGWLEAHRLNGRWNGERCHETPVPGKLTSTIIYAIIYFHDFMAPLLRALTLSLDSAVSTFSRSRLLFSLSISLSLSLSLFLSL